MHETHIPKELRCARHLHGVLYVPVNPGDVTAAGVIEVLCRWCADRETGITPTHRWRAMDAQRLPDRDNSEHRAA